MVTHTPPAAVADVDPATLTAAQLDGIACVRCGADDGPMAPVGTVPGHGQVFGHDEACAPGADEPADVVIRVEAVADVAARVGLPALDSTATVIRVDKMPLGAPAVGLIEKATGREVIVIDAGVPDFLAHLAAVRIVEGFERQATGTGTVGLIAQVVERVPGTVVDVPEGTR